MSQDPDIKMKVETRHDAHHREIERKEIREKYKPITE